MSNGDKTDRPLSLLAAIKRAGVEAEQRLLMDRDRMAALSQMRVPVISKALGEQKRHQDGHNP